MRLWWLGGIALLAVGCGTSTRASTSQNAAAKGVRTIALGPSSGVLGDATGVELLSYGLTVFDTGHVSNLMVRLNVSEVEVVQPQNLRRLKAEGIDAVLQVRAVANSRNDNFQSAAVKLTSTESGMVLAGVNWQNGRGAGRVAMADAARQIARSLAEAIRPEGKKAG